jgi:ligand-binding sensor domain-containing protein
MLKVQKELEVNLLLLSKKTNLMNKEKEFAISIVILCITILMLSSLQAQEINITRYTTRDGLPSNRIFDGVQTNSGHILLATDVGLISYDGKSFKPNNNTDTLRNAIIKLSFDEFDNLWAMPEWATSDVGKISKEQVELLPPILNNPENDFMPKNLTFLNKNDKIYPLVLDEFSRIHIYENNNWNIFFEADNDRRINNIHVNQNTIYLLTNKGILKLIDGELIPYQEINSQLPSLNVVQINFINESEFWIMSESWLGQVKNEKFSLATNKFNLTTTDQVFQETILRIFNENVLFGNEYSLYNFNLRTNSLEELIFDKASKGEGGTSIFIDYESNIWITTYRGLYKLRFIPFTNLNSDDGLLYNEVTAIEFIEGDNVALGQEGNLAIFNSKNKSIKNIPIEASGEELNIFLRIWDLLYDSRKRLWVVEAGKGLGLLNENKIRWLNLGLRKKIESIAEDHNGQIWLGTTHGLYKLIDENKIELYEPTSDMLIRKIFTGEDGNIYLATKYNGLGILNVNLIDFFKSENKDDNNIYALLESKKYGILIGAKSGLLTIIDGKLEKFTNNGFKIDKAIYMICEGSNQEVWFGLSDGLIKWDGTSSLNYTSSDGLTGLEINRDTGKRDQDDNIWFGTDGGLSIYNSDYDYRTSLMPKGKINSVESYKGIKHDLNNLTFDSKENNLIFNVSAFSFIDEKNNKFHVKLLDDNEQLVDSFITNNSNVRFSNLSYGDYTFQLRLENAKKNSERFNLLRKFFHQPTIYIFCLFLFAYCDGKHCNFIYNIQIL